MLRFVLSELALADIDAIADFSRQRWGAPRARAYVDALEGRLTELAHQPLLGQRRVDLADEMLSFPFESHIIFYSASEFGIIVVRVLHVRQDARRQLR